MILSIIALFVVIVSIILWFKEPRIFLVVFHTLVFPSRKGAALHIDKRVEFPESKSLEHNWKAIYEELNIVMSKNRTLPKFHQVDKSNDKISFDDGPAWRTVVIKAYDGWFENNLKMFPVTAKLLKVIPSVSTAMFSILDPHVNIPPHQGKFSGIMRYHLGLSVPSSDQCYIRVNGEKYTWKEGEGILFNDTYLHSVTNDTGDYRIVLFLDIKKQSSPFVKSINEFILYLIRLSPIFKNALKNGMIELN